MLNFSGCFEPFRTVLPKTDHKFPAVLGHFWSLYNFGLFWAIVCCCFCTIWNRFDPFCTDILVCFWQFRPNESNFGLFCNCNFWQFGPILGVFLLLFWTIKSSFGLFCGFWNFLNMLAMFDHVFGDLKPPWPLLCREFGQFLAFFWSFFVVIFGCFGQI